MTTNKRLIRDLREAEKKAVDALARYKFQMFGYWAAIWVHLNRIGNFRRPNPFSGLVKAARAQRRKPIASYDLRLVRQKNGVLKWVD